MSRTAVFFLSILVILPLALLLDIDAGTDGGLFALAAAACFFWWLAPRTPRANDDDNTPYSAPPDELTQMRAEIHRLRDEVQSLRDEMLSLKFRVHQSLAKSAAPPSPIPAKPAPVAHPSADPFPDFTPSPIPAKPAPVAPPSADPFPDFRPSPTPAKPAPVAPPSVDPFPDFTPSPKTPAPVAEPAPVRQALSEPVPSRSERAAAPPRPTPSEPPPLRPAARDADADPKPLLPAFFTENVLLKAGIAILFLGLAFLLRYVSGVVHISIPMRYLGVVLMALVLAVIGWRLRHKRRYYALAVQGAALAILYLTTLAALKLHGLLSPLLAFALMCTVAGAMVALAIRQNALVLAQVALVGGLAAPVLTSGGQTHYWALFAYLALLNSAVAAIAWFKAWRSLNVIGLAGSLYIASLWGSQHYTADAFIFVEIFLFYHVLLYALIVWFHARHRLADDDRPRLPDDAPLRALLDHAWRGMSDVGVLDSGVLFASALGTFALQVWASAPFAYGAAWSALAFAAFYALAAGVLFAERATLRPLFDGFVTLAALFATLAVPLAFDPRWTAATWGVQAALGYVFATRQESPHGRLFALAVYALASVALLPSFQLAPNETIVLQGSLLNVLLHLGAGMLMLAVRRDASTALWEWTARLAVLLMCLAQMVALPLMLLPLEWAAATWGVLAAGVHALALRFVPLAQWPAVALYALAFAVLGAQCAPQWLEGLPLLRAPVLPMLVNALAGVALLADLRRDGEAIAPDSAMLAMLWAQSVALPLAFAAPTLAAWLLLLPALLLAALQWRRAFGWDALAIAASALCALFLMFGRAEDWWRYAGLALLMWPMAWLLHRAPWRADRSWQAQANTIGGWMVLVCATLAAIAASVLHPWIVNLAGGSGAMFVLLPAFAALLVLGRFAHWREAQWASAAFTPLNALFFATLVVGYHGVFAAPLLWSFGVLLALLCHAAIVWPLICKRFVWLHILGFNVYPLAFSTVWFMQGEALSLLSFAALLTPALIALALAAFGVLRAPRLAYHGAGALPLVLVLLATLLYFNLRHAGGDFYLPLFNAIELPSALAAYVLYRWWRASDLPALSALVPLPAVFWAMAGAWLWGSMLILRIAHHYFAVPWESAALLSSFGVQAALSLAWACGAIVLMALGSQRGVRSVWQCGAALMGIVIVKLFVVELGDSGGIARIVSFIGVGVLLLAVSYFAPAPRKDQDE